MREILLEQMILADAGKISWSDSNQMRIPERRMVLGILKEISEERKKQMAVHRGGVKMHSRR